MDVTRNTDCRDATSVPCRKKAFVVRRRGGRQDNGNIDITWLKWSETDVRGFAICRGIRARQYGRKVGSGEQADKGVLTSRKLPIADQLNFSRVGGRGGGGDEETAVSRRVSSAQLNPLGAAVAC